MQNLANVHPIRDDVRNIESALCHGTKETKVREFENMALITHLPLSNKVKVIKESLSPYFTRKQQ